MARRSMSVVESLAAVAELQQEQQDFAEIRGRRLPFSSLIRPDFFDPDHLAELRKWFFAAQPFEHLVLKDIFSETLLDLVHEEFDLMSSEKMRACLGTHETVYRSQISPVLGPASQFYFNIVNSGPFLEAMAQISETPSLVADVTLKNGGLHETRAGGRFDVHLDYGMDERTFIPNKLVLLTYLNRDWLPEYGGDLELWDREKCVTRVAPHFGHSILFMHSDRSFHGHPNPLTPPEGRTRRSVASYYYAHPAGTFAPSHLTHSRFLSDTKSRELRASVRNTMMWVTPPIVWEGIKRVRTGLGRALRKT